MQTTLLGLAIAIILALVAALVAPLVVDWSLYRSAFEQEATRLVGTPVRVKGAIDARILPTPRLKLRDVEVGEADRQSQLHAGAVELEVGLGPLLRGEVRATELRLVAPQVTLALDSSGAIDWPAPQPSFRADAFAVSRLTIEDGRLLLADAGSGSRVALQKLWFDGDIRSFYGPFHGEGAFVAGDELYGYRISGGRYDGDSGLKIKLGIDPSNRPLTGEIEGTIAIKQGVPEFEGTLALARPVGAALARGERVMSDPWQFNGKVHATPAAASLQELTLQYGPEERAINLTGKAEVALGAHPRLDGTVSARQVDVDRALADPDLTHRPPLLMVRSFFEAFVAAVKPPLPGTVGVTVDAMTVGGTTIQSLHGNVRFDDKGWSFNDVAFRAPGFTEVSLSGRLDNGAQGVSFTGPARLESADLKGLMGWLEGRSGSITGTGESLTARADITIASDRFTLDRLVATHDQENVEGRLAYAWAAGNRPASLDGQLRAANLNIDAFTAFARAALSDAAVEAPRQVALVLDVGKATFAGVEARGINARLKFDSGTLHIDRLQIADFGGGALDVGGRIDELSSQPRGRLTLDLDARTLSGLTDIGGRVAPKVADGFRPFADLLAPAKVHGVLTVDRAPTAGSMAKLELGGAVGAMRVTLTGEATGDPAHADAALLRLSSRFDADDGGAVVRLLDLDRVVAVDQLPGQLTFSASGPFNGAVRFKSLATAGGFSAAADGALRLGAEQGPTGSAQIKMQAADVRPLYRTLTGQTPATVAPVFASAIVGIAGREIACTDLNVTVGKASVRGRLDVKTGKPVGIEGAIEADDVEAVPLAALLLGLPGAAPGTGALWSSSPAGPGAFGAFAGAVTFKFGRAALIPALGARDLKGVVRFKPGEMALADLDGTLAGGHLGGDLTFHHDSDQFALHGRLELTGASAGGLLGPNRNAVDGLVSLSLRGDSLGPSAETLVGALHGGGSIAFKNIRIAGIDPAAFDAALGAADADGMADPAKVRSAVSAAMDAGRLVVPQGDAPLTITGGEVHLASATLHAQGDDTVVLDGVLDLNRATVDARLTLSRQPAANALIPGRPEVSVSVKGPLGSPERKVDLAALTGWLTMRAAEFQTRRLESIEANRRDDTIGPVVRPPSPALRFIPRGTALETLDHGGMPAVPPARTPDHLRSEIAPTPGGSRTAAPRAGAAGDKTTATAEQDRAHSTAPAAVPHAPLDLLFRSQN